MGKIFSPMSGYWLHSTIRGFTFHDDFWLVLGDLLASSSQLHFEADFCALLRLWALLHSFSCAEHSLSRPKHVICDAQLSHYCCLQKKLQFDDFFLDRFCKRTVGLVQGLFYAFLTKLSGEVPPLTIMLHGSHSQPFTAF